MSGLFVQPPAPRTRLGQHRQLSLLAGMHVSPLCLGAMSIGDKWEQVGFGTMDKAGERELYRYGEQLNRTSRPPKSLLASGWSSAGSATRWSSPRRCVRSMVWRESEVDTESVWQYTTNAKRGSDIPRQTHYVGNNMKSLHLSLAASLTKLRTDYVDILYVHWWDWSCGVKEVMDGLHNLAAQGKVLYLANMYARMANQTPFMIYQRAWGILQRGFERDIIPMAREEGEYTRLGTANPRNWHGLSQVWHWLPGTCLLGGKTRTDAEEERRRQTDENGGKQKLCGESRY
ncbi:NADP-dependent oxidoreductase domain-containing protein [Fomitopsis betulina]|nr:NADP-dependent oxidoreductase domain-containing protein [Fomitopsis betulina]